MGADLAYPFTTVADTDESLEALVVRRVSREPDAEFLLAMLGIES